MVAEKLVQFFTLAAMCTLSSAIYIHFWQPSLPSVVALNAIVIALCAPPYLAWNFLLRDISETKLVKPPPVVDTRDDSIDEVIQEHSLQSQRTRLTALRKLEIEEQVKLA